MRSELYSTSGEAFLSETSTENTRRTNLPYRYRSPNYSFIYLISTLDSGFPDCLKIYPFCLVWHKLVTHTHEYVTQDPKSQVTCPSCH